MIPTARLTAFAATVDLDRAAAFYIDVLGLALISRDPYAVVVDGQGAELRLTLVSATAHAQYTVLGWEVPDLDAAVDHLRARGVHAGTDAEPAPGGVRAE